MGVISSSQLEIDIVDIQLALPRFEEGVYLVVEQYLEINLRTIGGHQCPSFLVMVIIV